MYQWSADISTNFLSGVSPLLHGFIVLMALQSLIPYFQSNLFDGGLNNIIYTFEIIYIVNNKMMQPAAILAPSYRLYYLICIIYSSSFFFGLLKKFSFYCFL